MVTATRILEFDAAHRVPGHEGKCRHLHGHRYKVELTVRAEHGLDSLGRVIDFSVMKSIVGQWIDENLDHNTILYRDDPLADVLMGYAFIRLRAPFLMEDIPTAENIAKLIFEQSQSMLTTHHITVVSVLVWETPNCYAVYQVETK